MDDGTQLALQRSLAEPGNIKRVEQDDGSVRYKNVVMLAPGEWTDAKSRTTFYYSPEGIANSVDNWANNNLHLNHDGQDTVLADIGYVDDETVDSDDKGRMYGDIVFHRRTQTSKDAEALMELAVETEGEQGLSGPSVEIIETKDEYDADRGMDETTEMVFSGLGLVTSPASRTVAFEEQMKAMQDASPEGVRLMRNYKSGENHGTSMGRDDFHDKLRTLRNLQSDEELEKLTSAVEQFRESSDSDSLGDLIDWAGEELSDEMAQTVANLVEEFAANLDEDASLEDATVDDLQNWAQGQMESGEDGDDEGEEEEAEEEPEEEDDEETEQENEAPEDDDTPDLEALEERLSDIEDSLEAMPDATELQGVNEEISELSETVEDVTRDLQDIKDEPVERGLHAEDSEGDDDPVAMLSASRVDRDRVGKPGALR